MRRRAAAAALLLGNVVGVLAVPAPASAATPGVKVRTGIQYVVDGQPQRLDVYSPSKVPTKAPAAVFVHGGGWTGGSRTEWAKDASSLAALGWVAFTIDYRTDSPTPWSSEPADVRAAVDWVQRNAKTYGLDPARIALIGSSAGAQLAAVEAATGTGAAGLPGRVKAVVSWSGPMDMALLTAEYGCVDSPCSYTTQWPAAMAQQFEGGCLPADCPDRWAATSPVNQVDAGDPRMLLVNSTAEMIPLEQLSVMERRLNDAQVAVQTLVLDGTLHGAGYHDLAWPVTVDFLRANV